MLSYSWPLYQLGTTQLMMADIYASDGGDGGVRWQSIVCAMTAFLQALYMYLEHEGHLFIVQKTEPHYIMFWTSMWDFITFSVEITIEFSKHSITPFAELTPPEMRSVYRKLEWNLDDGEWRVRVSIRLISERTSHTVRIIEIVLQSNWVVCSVNRSRMKGAVAIYADSAKSR